MEERRWHSAVHGLQGARLLSSLRPHYVGLKPAFSNVPESYTELSTSDGAILFRLRSEYCDHSVHTGKWIGKIGNKMRPREQRLCPCCNNGMIDTVVHGFLECSHFSTIRDALNKAIYPKLSKELQQRLQPIEMKNQLWVTLLLEGVPPQDLGHWWQVPLRDLRRQCITNLELEYTRTLNGRNILRNYKMPFIRAFYCSRKKFRTDIEEPQWRAKKEELMKEKLQTRRAIQDMERLTKQMVDKLVIN